MKYLIELINLFIMQSNEENKDETCIEKFEKKSKLLIYETLTIMLKDDKTSLIMAIITKLIDFIQLASFAFSTQVNFPWNAGGFLSLLKQLSTIIQILFVLFTITWTINLFIFYFCVFLVIIVVIDITYVMVSISKKKFAMIWPLTFLRKFCGLFLTILFQPILGQLLSMLSCVNVNGVQVQSQYPEIQCWTGSHIIHSAIGMVTSIIFIILALIVTLTFFEPCTKSKNKEARTNSRANLIQILYKVCTSFFFNFLTDDMYLWVNVFLLLIFSLVLYFYAKKERPYYDDIISAIWNICNAVIIYINIVLFIVMLLRPYKFEGGLYLIACGVPLVAFFEFSSESMESKYLQKKYFEITSEKDLILYTRFAQNLLSSETKIDMIHGYISFHLSYCKSPKCIITMEMNEEEENTEEMNVFLKKWKKKLLRVTPIHLCQIYKFYLKKYPTYKSLRLRYSLYLIEQIQNSRKGLIQLKKAEVSRPPMDEEFTIYRMKKLITTDSKDSSGQQMDIVSLIAFDNYFREFKADTLESSSLLFEYWSILIRKMPNLSKFEETSRTLSLKLEKVEIDWKEMQALNQNNPAALKMYCEFISEILNDKEAARLMAKKLNRSNQKNTGLDAITDTSNNEELVSRSMTTDGSVCICISGESKKLGEIKFVSTQFSNVWGYLKHEVIGKNVKCLMSELYAERHDYYLKRTIESPEKASFVGMELKVLGKHKSGYIFWVFYCLKTLPSFSNNLCFYATFFPAKSFGEEPALFTSDLSFKILDYNMSTFKLLNLVPKSQELKNKTMKDLIPSLKDEVMLSNLLDTKEGLKVDVLFPNIPFSEDMLCSNSFQKQKLFTNKLQTISSFREKVGKIEALCKINKYKDKEGVFLGYIYTLSNRVNLDQSQEIIEPKENLQFIPPFEFHLNYSNAKYYIVPKENIPEISIAKPDEELIKQKSKIQNNEELKNISSIQKSQEKNQKFAQDLSYAESRYKEKTTWKYSEIKVFRIINGQKIPIEKAEEINIIKKINEIGNETTDVKVLNQEENTLVLNDHSPRKDQTADTSTRTYESLSNIFKNAIKLETKVKEGNSLILIAIFTAIIIIVMGSVDLSILINIINQTSKFGSYPWDLNVSFYSYIDVFLSSYLIFLSQSAIPISLRGITIDTLRANQKAGLVSIQTANAIFNEKTLAFPDYYLDTCVNKSYKVTKDYTDPLIFIFQSVQELRSDLSSGFAILDRKDTSSYVDTDSDFFFVHFNIMNGLYLMFNQQYSTSYNLLIKYITSQYNILITMTIVSIIIVVIGIFIMGPILRKGLRAKETVLSIFLYVPKSVVSRLKEKCRVYIENKSKINEGKGEEEDSNSESSSNILFEDESINNVEDQEKEKFSDLRVKEFSYEGFWVWPGILVKLILAAILFGLSFGLPFILVSTTYNTIFKGLYLIRLAAEFNFESQFFALSIFHSFTLNSLVTINYMDYADFNSKDMLALLSMKANFISSNSFTNYSLFNGLQNDFSTWLFTDMCESGDSKQTIISSFGSCSTALNGVFEIGFSNFLAYYFNIAANVLSTISLNYDERYIEDFDILIKIAYSKIINVKFSEYNSLIKKYVDSASSFCVSIKVIVFLFILFMVIVVFLVLWIPYIFKEMSAIVRNRQILTIIPIETISNVKLLKDAITKNIFNGKQIL